jgi:hypothetical protein
MQFGSDLKDDVSSEGWIGHALQIAAHAFGLARCVYSDHPGLGHKARVSAAFFVLFL